MERMEERKMYTTQEEMRGEKERVVLRCEMASRAELCREAPSPAAEGGRAGKKRREKGRKVCMSICLSFPLFFVHLYKHKNGRLFCVYLYVYIKKKKVYM